MTFYRKLRSIERDDLLNFSASELISFMGLVTILVMIPGPNTILVTQSVSLYGKKAGLYNVVGFISGLYVHAILFSIGLSILIIKSSEIFQTVKLLGAGYLATLGAISLYSAYKNDLKDIDDVPGRSDTTHQYSTEAIIKSFLKGFTSSVTNPKAALFFISFFPQFIHNYSNVLVQSLSLTMLYSIVSLAWYSLLIFFIHRCSKVFKSSRVQRRIKIITGFIFLGLGFKLATQK
ncbi:putative threonine efflux protein [Desulfosporosinus meridiei DSM 13257]|uniref:Putative threonine efflux protein n=1 Tax=Desulfosporosinus meridiei (strain ATCC BAA-275 / DSM 13257 / KCTC 12902 / NCIMB 13706 / S10) TaxID=768704 RepID=J7J253_DESMD|nr:putative threonine efflux protein [Desulfosporosinus meridiei DSM 13257]